MGMFSFCSEADIKWDNSKSLQKVTVILVFALAADVVLCFWTSFIQGKATPAHQCTSWGGIVFSSQPGHYFLLSNFLFRISLSLRVVTKQQKEQGPGPLSFLLLPWVISQICSMRWGKKVFPDETLGQNGNLENFRGTGKVKPECLVTLLKKKCLLQAEATAVLCLICFFF